MAELVAEGKGRHICLSEAGAATAALSRPGSPRCRASTRHGPAARSGRSSPPPAHSASHSWRTHPSAVAPHRRPDIPRLLAADDIRRDQPRFRTENLPANLRLVPRVRELAAGLGRTPAQLALAQLPAQPGTAAIASPPAADGASPGPPTPGHTALAAGRVLEGPVVGRAVDAPHVGVHGRGLLWDGATRPVRPRLRTPWCCHLG